MKNNELFFQNEVSYKTFGLLHRFILDFYFGIEFEKIIVKPTNLNENERQYFADKNCKMLNRLQENIELKTKDKNNYKKAELFIYILKNLSSTSEKKFIEEIYKSKSHCIYRFLDFSKKLTNLAVLRLKIIAFVKKNKLNQINYFLNQEFQKFLIDNLTELLIKENTALKLSEEEKSLSKQVLSENFISGDFTEIFNMIDGKKEMFLEYCEFSKALTELMKIDGVGLGKTGFLTYLSKKIKGMKKRRLENKILENDFYQLILVLNELPKFFK